MSLRLHYAVLDDEGRVVRRGWCEAPLLRTKLGESPLGEPAEGDPVPRARAAGYRLYLGPTKLGQRIAEAARKPAVEEG